MDNIKIDTAGITCDAANIRVDCRGQTCPVPLVEVRKALKKARAGEMIEVTGTHPASKKEIPMAVESLKAHLVSVEGTDTDWKIVIRR
jgi:tRNA 2-thiouridine synthesizing protein A